MSYLITITETDNDRFHLRQPKMEIVYFTLLHGKNSDYNQGAIAYHYTVIYDHRECLVVNSKSTFLSYFKVGIDLITEFTLAIIPPIPMLLSSKGH